MGKGYYKTSVLYHRNKALQLALPALREINAANCHAVFAFASLIALSMFADPGSASTRSPIDDILNVIPLLRGVETVLHSEGVLEWINDGELQPLFGPRAQFGIKWAAAATRSLPEAIEARFNELKMLNKQCAAHGLRLECYDTAIDMLRNSYAVLIHDMGKSTYHDITSILVWGALVPDDYLIALRARRPMALVILAHYGVLIHYLKDQWWSQDKGHLLVHAIGNVLPQRWKIAIKWPLEATAKI